MALSGCFLASSEERRRAAGGGHLCLACQKIYMHIFRLISCTIFFPTTFLPKRQTRSPIVPWFVFLLPFCCSFYILRTTFWLNKFKRELIPHPESPGFRGHRQPCTWAWRAGKPGQIPSIFYRLTESNPANAAKTHTRKSRRRCRRIGLLRYVVASLAHQGNRSARQCTKRGTWEGASPTYDVLNATHPVQQSSAYSSPSSSHSCYTHHSQAMYTLGGREFACPLCVADRDGPSGHFVFVGVAANGKPLAWNNLLTKPNEQAVRYPKPSMWGKSVRVHVLTKKNPFAPAAGGGLADRQNQITRRQHQPGALRIAAVI